MIGYTILYDILERISVNYIHTVFLIKMRILSMITFSDRCSFYAISNPEVVRIVDRLKMAEDFSKLFSWHV